MSRSNAIRFAPTVRVGRHRFGQLHRWIAPIGETLQVQHRRVGRYIVILISVEIVLRLYEPFLR